MRDQTGVRWMRVLIAGVLTEASVVLLIVIIVTTYKYGLSPTETEYQSFAGRVGFVAGVFGGALTAFLLALWVCGSLRAGFLVNGFLAGCVAALLHVGLFAASKAEFQLAYVMADGLKLAGGVLGGYVAQRRYQSDSFVSDNRAA